MTFKFDLGTSYFARTELLLAVLICSFSVLLFSCSSRNANLSSQDQSSNLTVSSDSQPSSNSSDNQQMLGELRERADEQSKKISNLEQSVQRLQSTRRVLQGRLKKLRNKLNNTQSDRQKEREQIQQFSRRIDNLNQSIQNIRRERNKAQGEVRQLKQKLNQMQERIQSKSMTRSQSWASTVGLLVSAFGAMILALFSLYGAFTGDESEGPQHRLYFTYSSFVGWALLIIGFILQFFGS